ncbi:hypothetical protein TrLO_g121 [Triparma laevis f. longispina]|uniref:Uncharacterized protein n=1 Tax=Triparma laevis f. longispina TaxID=1714387 RepID=A0A9W7F8F1_9STRA|nr:hypothetical protein TrLO_g121 [Triparma laevis f. longispina]
MSPMNDPPLTPFKVSTPAPPSPPPPPPPQPKPFDPADLINNHIQIYRSAVTITIAGLVIFALRKTPPFTRPRSLPSIPSYDFYNRRFLRGRLVSLAESKLSDGTKQTPICFNLVTQSPIERFPFLNVLGIFNFLHRLTTPLVVELRNVSWPNDVGFGMVDDSWLQQFVATKPSVSVQLISRRISAKDNQKQAAVGDVHWRPFSFPHLQKKDLAESLVSYGRAVPAATGVDSHPIINGVEFEMNLDGSKEVDILKADVQRMRALNKMEDEARKNQRGCWSGVYVEEEPVTECVLGFIKTIFSRFRK